MCFVQKEDKGEVYRKVRLSKTPVNVSNPLHTAISKSWESMVGLEIHAQISSKSKMFSGSAVKFSSPPNSLVSFLDASLPGTLPVLNKYCVEAGVLTSLALDCQINRISYFDRKHYFYADLPAGYQITQQRVPLATNGKIEFSLFDQNSSKNEPQKMCVRLKQIQLEHDSGKSLHDDVNHETLVDLNRSGIGLMELVSEPDLQNGSQAAAMVRELQLILQYIGTCDGKMEEGSLRVDANVSVNRPGEPPGTRTEVKNINSARFVKIAIDNEIQRHIQILENGGKVNHETRAFDFKLGQSVSIRDKEGFSDYRFMPEPNLPPLVIYDKKTIMNASKDDIAVNIDDLRKKLPELPEQQRQRLTRHYGIPLLHSMVLMQEDGLVEYFESIVQEKSRNAKTVADWIITVFLKELNAHGMTLKDSPVSSHLIGQLIDLMTDGVVSVNTAKKIMPILFTDETRSLTQIIESKNWAQIRDEKHLQTLCDSVIANNMTVVKAYIDGNNKVFNRLMGLIQHQTQGRADPGLVRKILQTKLEEMKLK
ncbi:glutamyl-tRNA(Gln) amidotransferase subunit B, mitochondrial-like [Saccoglossus kowalevskii]|uniref:Glutamyl-tRNA(Gln) amidotransferase subunit B, mitochondrial n=1 Tax=Saccoglossus kowalevskii TaxID=10224 RepID=A0ABM0MWT6_SACKO|nr:PREDICTED: glutamyl-tRNA(Gln) amidotransferase subunit B, mitochondrial-like [Saccoglossus kowalevskii]